jgi:hypothetical protein
MHLAIIHSADLASLRHTLTRWTLRGVCSTHRGRQEHCVRMTVQSWVCWSITTPTTTTTRTVSDENVGRPPQSIDAGHRKVRRSECSEENHLAADVLL